MTIQEAHDVIQSLRIDNSDKTSLKLLERWNILLFELKELELKEKELAQIEEELNVHLTKIKSDPSSRVLKEALESFLRFLNDRLNIKNGTRTIMLGMMIGLLIGFTTHLSMWTGILIGAGLGFAYHAYQRKNYRSIKTNLEDFWV